MLQSDTLDWAFPSASRMGSGGQRCLAADERGGSLTRVVVSQPLMRSRYWLRRLRYRLLAPANPQPLSGRLVPEEEVWADSRFVSDVFDNFGELIDNF